MIPRDVITIISGRAGVSKSTFSLYLTALATKGLAEGDYKGTPLNVAITAKEDKHGVQKLRLIASGADLDHVRFLDMADYTNGTPRPGRLAIPDDLDRVADALADNDIRLWIIDPIESYIGGDTNKRDDVRAALDPLAAMAERLNIAIVAINHFNKGGGYASDKVSGSHAFRDIVRSLLLVARDDKTGDCVMTQDKNNYGPTAGQSWSYGLQSTDIIDDEGETCHIPKIVGFMKTDRSVNEVINANANAGARPVERADRGEVAEWLTEYLTEGPAPFRQIAADAAEEGYTKTQLDNARRRARSPWIVTERDPTYTGRGKRYLWQLSDTAPTSNR
nr:AAA family ATPase [Bifidobacterium simiarum]